jgi:hypothetical protein
MVMSKLVPGFSKLWVLQGLVLSASLCIQVVPVKAGQTNPNTGTIQANDKTVVYKKRVASKPKSIVVASAQNGSVQDVAVRPARPSYGIGSYICTPSGFGHLATCAARR